MIYGDVLHTIRKQVAVVIFISEGFVWPNELSCAVFYLSFVADDYKQIVKSYLKSIVCILLTCATIGWGADQRKYQDSASLAFGRMTSGFPSQRANNAENVFICWRYHVNLSDDDPVIFQDDQAPVPLSIFRSNSKFDENSKHSSVKYTRPITTIFCTRHDSVTVVTCAKCRCDRSSIFETRAFWIFIEFRIRSKYA